MDYDTRKALAVLASGKTNLKALMDEIKVAEKLQKLRRPSSTSTIAAGRRKNSSSKRQEAENAVNDNQDKPKKKRNETTPNSTTTLQKAYDSEAQLRDVLNAKILQPGFSPRGWRCVCVAERRGDDT